MEQQEVIRNEIMEILNNIQNDELLEYLYWFIKLKAEQ